MDRFHFFEKLSFRFKNDKEKMKNETIVLKNETTVFENNPFFTTVFNKDPSLRIVNDLCKRKYIFLIGKSEVRNYSLDNKPFQTTIISLSFGKKF